MTIVNALPALVISVLLMVTACGSLDSRDVDIDYSHNVVGTGTVMTDYKMGSTDSTEAIGRVRGTGEVVNKYIFQSNSSDNLTINDQFYFTDIKTEYEMTIRNYPQMTKIPGSPRMIGTTWAKSFNIDLL